MIKYVGFDKDGTLMDSMGTYAKIWGEIFNKEYGIDEIEASDFLIQTAGQSTEVQVDALLKKHNIFLSKEDVFKKGNQIGEELANHSNSPAFSDVSACLSLLRNNNYKIFVSSNQQEDVVKRDLERTGLLQYINFFAGIRPDNIEYRKGEPHFRAAADYFGVLFETFVKETVFIGDTPTDLKVSSESNISCIIRKSANSGNEMLDKEAKFVVEDFSNLPELIKSI